MTSKSTDLVIIGGGPAGLAAALTFARVKRPAIIFDSGLYRNANTNASHTIPGFDGQDPMIYKGKVRAEIEKSYGGWVEFRDEKVLSVKKSSEAGMDFVVEGEVSGVITARKVIVATGIQDNLPAIPGLKETWGRRAIHCVFCDGTETADTPIAFLVTPNMANFNPMIIEGALKLWAPMNHPRVHILTHGLDPSDPAQLAAAGLEKYMTAIQKRGWAIIPDTIESMEETPSDLLVYFKGDRAMLPLGHIVVMPESWSPHPHAADFLTPELLKDALSPTGTIAPPDAKDLGGSGMPPRMGDDPRTATKGLFWAGNAGSFMGNVNVSVAQGQAAGYMAAETLGKEDLAQLNT